MKEEFIDYKELLSRLEKGKSHLLLGNGFNNALTVKTNYADIFKRMIELFPVYEMLSDVINICENDLEKVIGVLQKNIGKNASNKAFLYKFIEKKFKADFIKATNAIVRENLKNIYQEKNEGIYLLFEKFDNYFTLNNDPLLYLLLLKFKKSKSKEIPLLVFQSNDRLFDDSMSDLEKETFDIIKTAYENGQIRIHSEDLSVTKFLKDLHKSTLKNHTKDLVKANLGKISNSSFKKHIISFYLILTTIQKY